MKKLILTLALLSLCITLPCKTANAGINIGEYIKDLPVQQGVAYSLKDSEFTHISTAVLFNKWNLGVEAGYMDNGKLLGAVSYKLLDLKNIVNTPIIKELSFRPGLYASFDEIDTGDPKVDYGISLTILSFQF